VDRISQSVYFVDKENKLKLLQYLLKDTTIASALVFTRTKHGADRVARGLGKINIAAQAIHGDKSQNARQQALNNFKSGVTRVLVATDIAARGIDIDELSHVINFNLPNIPETYVHRIGRTGRAGLSGTAISFCDQEEMSYLKDIERLIKKKVPIVKEHPYPMESVSTHDIKVEASMAATTKKRK
jgi:ATP-dependent RNA helicase RhlE